WAVLQPMQTILLLLSYSRLSFAELLHSGLASSTFCCLRCLQSGLAHHLAFRRLRTRKLDPVAKEHRRCGNVHGVSWSVCDWSSSSFQPHLESAGRHAPQP